jgi:hypothetical protein
LPNAITGRRPMKRLMPTGLPGPSSTNSGFGSLTSTGLWSRISNFTTPLEPITCSGGMPYVASANTRMNSTPPPDTMNVLKPFARRYASTSSIGW